MALNGTLGLGFLFTASDLATGVMRKVKTGLMDVEGASTEAGKAYGDAFKSFGKGLMVMGAGLGVATVLEHAVHVAGDFSKAIALVATEADAAAYSQAQMRDVTLGLSQAYGTAPVEQAQALYKAVALGADTAARSQAFLNSANLLAVAGNADLVTSTNALGGALNAYGESFDKAEEYADTFFTAVRMGNTTVQDMTGSIGRITASAHEAGISFAEIAAAEAVMTNQGVNSYEAISGLHEAIANIVHPTKEARVEAARLGITFSETELRTKGLRGFLDEITSSAKFSENSLGQLFESVRGSNAMQQLTNNNLQQYDRVLTEMGKKSGSTRKGFELMTDTLDFQEKQFKAAGEAMQIAFGHPLEMLGKGVLKFVIPFVQAIAKIPAPLAKVVGVLLAVSSGIVIVTGAAMALSGAFTLMAPVAVAAGAMIAAGFWPVTIAVAAASAAFALFRERAGNDVDTMANETKDSAEKMRLALDALSTSPTAASSKMQLAFADQAKNTESFSNSIKLTWEGLTQAFTDGYFSGAVMEDLNRANNLGLKQTIIDVHYFSEQIVKFFKGMWSGVSYWIDKIVGAIDTIGDKVNDAMEWLSKPGGLFVADAPSTSKSFDNQGKPVVVPPTNEPNASDENGNPIVAPPPPIGADDGAGLMSTEANASFGLTSIPHVSTHNPKGRIRHVDLPGIPTGDYEEGAGGFAPEAQDAEGNISGHYKTASFRNRAGGLDADNAEVKNYLETIAKNSGQQQALTAYLMMDGEVLARALAKTTRADQVRSSTPAPTSVR